MMTTVNSTTYAAQVAGKIALNPGVNHTGLLIASTGYEASALAANDVINLFKLPKNAVVHAFIIAFDDLGTDTSLDIGDEKDADRFVDGLDTATAGGTVITILPDAAGYIVGSNDEDGVIKATNLGGAATGTIKVSCLYAI